MQDAVVMELNKEREVQTPNRSHKVERLAEYIQEQNACSACYGSLIHALERLDKKGHLNKIKSKICIGQGFQGRQGDGLGIGICTRRFTHNVPGCPPKARDIVQFFERHI